MVQFNPEVLYYSGGDGFERVLDLIEAGSRGVLTHIRDAFGESLGAVPQA